MGTEVDDVLDEFLALTLTFEQTGTPGLEGFLAWFAAAPIRSSARLNAARGVVRIMTVHGAKGLEAPLVILVDSGRHRWCRNTIRRFWRAGVQTTKAAPEALVWLPPRPREPTGTKRRLRPSERRRKRNTGGCSMWR
ncbi:MAG: hypothetical protein HPM95_18385 [Alphaproteobacteria bacterium]|nr:hypothetical protein [Alphaproteobacteria bacterium]